MVELLPYLEQNNVYKALDHNKGWQAQANKAAAAPLKVVRCPGWSDPPEQAHHTSYIGVAGSGAEAAILLLNDPRCGFFGYSRTLKLADVKDGLSNTLLFLETQRDNGPWAAGGPATVRGVDGEADPLLGKDGAFGYHAGASRWNFGRVPVRIMAAMGDGSAKSLLDTVSTDVMTALATVAGKDNDALSGAW